MTMYEMSKQILQKVSFDKSLFRKELLKAAKWLRQEERMLLYAWCLSYFGSEYHTIVREVFNSI